MQEDEKHILEQFEARLRDLLGKHKELKEENQALKEEIERHSPLQVIVENSQEDKILAFASNSEIRGWSVAPVKSAKLVHFTADGQEVVKDISSSIWR